MCWLVCALAVTAGTRASKQPICAAKIKTVQSDCQQELSLKLRQQQLLCGLQVNLRLALCLRHQTKWQIVCIAGSILLWYLFVLLYSGLSPRATQSFNKFANVYYVFYQLLAWPSTYLTAFLGEPRHYADQQAPTFFCVFSASSPSSSPRCTSWCHGAVCIICQ